MAELLGVTQLIVPRHRRKYGRSTAPGRPDATRVLDLIPLGRHVTLNGSVRCPLFAEL
jgi:hypothetical protein